MGAFSRLHCASDPSLLGEFFGPVELAPQTSKKFGSLVTFLESGLEIQPALTPKSPTNEENQIRRSLLERFQWAALDPPFSERGEYKCLMSSWLNSEGAHFRSFVRLGHSRKRKNSKSGRGRRGRVLKQAEFQF